MRRQPQESAPWRVDPYRVRFARSPAFSRVPGPSFRPAPCKHADAMSESRLATPTSVAEIDPNELRVTRLRALRGPNYWRLAPVIACDVRLGALESVKSADVPGFIDGLLDALPTLSEHPCTIGAPGGFVERLERGTHIPHILEHVALELQNLAGSDVGFGRVVPSGDAGVWWVIVAYDEEDVGLQGMRDAVSLVRASLGGPPFDTAAAVASLQDLFERVRLGPSTWAIVEEARRRGIPVRRLNSRSLVQLGLGRNLRRIQATLTDHTSAIAIEIAQDKDDTKRVLEAIGLPVPHGDVAATAEEAVGLAQEIGFPVILKPLDLSHGRGISPRLTDEAAVRDAWVRGSQYTDRLIVEQFAEGRDHRVLVIGGKVVAVAERVPAHVTGDGTHSVRELIDLANQDPRRGIGHTKVLTRLACDETTVEFLARSGLTLESVPKDGEMVCLRATANLSTGGTSIDRTDEIHPSNVTACEMAAGVVGLDIAGIDVITPDISVPFRENGAAIIEVNAAPGVRMHTHPTEGEPRNIGAPIIDMLYPPGAPTAIPVLSVTGTNGKTTTVRLIAHIFRHTGKTVGFTTTDGVYLNNRLVIEGDMTGPFSANIILSNPTVDVAVLETARGGILRAGLGFDECDVGVVLNVSADHLGLGGINTIEQLADVKSVIAAVVKREGHAVLNADDPLVLGMGKRSPGDVVLFSTGGESDNPAIADHLARSGIAVIVERDTFVVRRGRLRIPIAAVREVPLMMGGAARFQLGNILAAIATAYVQGIRYDDIRAGLLSFFPSPALTPGRLNLMRVGRGRLLVDYAHNAAAVAGLMEFVSALDTGKRVGVVTAPGDRRDHDIRELGRLAAALDHVIIKEDSDRRGRAPGEIAALVRDGLVSGGLAAEHIEVVTDELEAVERAIALLDDRDIAVILADDVPVVLEHLRGRSLPAAAP
jgi:cyanophycin synthetase